MGALRGARENWRVVRGLVSVGGERVRGHEVIRLFGMDRDTVAADTGLPVLPPRNAVIELAVIVLAIIAIDWLLPDQGLADIGPNPYWLPVLLMSLQYGTVSGLLAAGVGIAMTMLSGIPEQGVGENHFTFLLRIWAEPILWIAVAVLLGQFRIRQISAKRELARQVQELSAQRQALADYSTNLRLRCEAVERRIAGRDNAPTLELLAALAELGRPDCAVQPALARLVELAIPGAEASVWLLDGAWLRKIADNSGEHGGIRAAELTAVHPLYRAIVERGEAVSVLDAGQEVTLSGEGVAAVPIRFGSDGRAAGMLKLDSAAAGYLGDDTLRALEGVALVLAHRLQAPVPATSRGAEAAGAVQADATSSTGAVRAFFGRTTTWLRRPGGQAADASSTNGATSGDDAVVPAQPRTAR